MATESLIDFRPGGSNTSSFVGSRSGRSGSSSSDDRIEGVEHRVSANRDLDIGQTNPREIETSLAKRGLPLKPVDSFVALGSTCTLFGGQDAVPLESSSAARGISQLSSQNPSQTLGSPADLESRMFGDFTTKYGPSHRNVLERSEEQAEVFANMK
jgi:hypothetical protein